MLNLSFQQQVERFVEREIATFHAKRTLNMEKLALKDLLGNKNPYLFRAKHYETAEGLICALLDARLSSGEEAMFGQFMESLAIFISEQKCDGQKAATEGLDIDLKRDGVRYLIAVKSGKNWGNSDQHKKLRQNFKNAVKVLRQNKSVGQIQPTLGICYGKFKTVDNGEFLHIGGQAFWELISGEPDLYKDIIEPVGYKAREFNEEFAEKKAQALNRMSLEFGNRFLTAQGAIDWPGLVEFVSRNIGAPPGAS